MTFWFGVVIVIALPIVILRRWLTRVERQAVENPEELEAAEREVRELDAFASPEDAADLPDWGPGAPH